LLATGVVDILPRISGLAELWQKGESVFLCPYCHGWEVQDRPWALLATDVAHVEWALFLKGWTDDLIVFTNGACYVPDDLQARLGRAKILLEERPIQRLLSCLEASGGNGDHLKAIALADGTRIEREVLFIRSEQRQTDLIQTLGLNLTEAGYVAIDAAMQTSVPGIYAAGDLTTPMQQALAGAADGARAAAMINHRLNLE
ncbi:MAG: NAD(P)/FAD-dependent oxidoreductase, partial [Leptospirales bacterium]